MKAEDVYIGFQFTADPDIYSYAEGRVCTVTEVSADRIFWNVEGMTQNYEEYDGFCYDDAATKEQFDGWFLRVDGIEHLPEPNWEV